MAEQWLSIVEYARKYSLSDMTVRRRIKNGRINAVLKDGKYYIPASEVPPRALADDDEPAPRRDIGAEGRDRRYPTPAAAAPMPVVKANRPPAPAAPAYESREWVGKPAPSHAAPAPHAHDPNPAASYAHPAYAGASGHVAPSYPMPNRGAASHRTESVGQEILSSRIDALASACEKAVAELKKGEGLLAQKYEAKVRALESELRGKDREIKELLQQNEDLKLLLKFVEKKPAGK